MGKKSLEIAGPGVDGTIAMLHKAYTFEMSTFHYFQYVANNIEGLGVLHEDFFEERAKEELGRAEKVNERLMELGTNPTDDPARWEQESGVGRLQPKRHLSLRSAIEKALEFERAAIGLYDDLSNATNNKDHGTYELALDLLEDKLEDEETMENILARLEIRDVRETMAA
jgi:bacterioferritin